MGERKINVSKVIITVISAIILISLITVLTIFLTNKKQAVEVISDTEQKNMESKKDENVWQIKLGIKRSSKVKELFVNMIDHYQKDLLEMHLLWMIMKQKIF